ncbi:hypothetical protein DFH28DRAFT_1086459 [Melampsora americana]|nr:hypothetical protein DFH28DRAFT_1086459 [Melampsora americana]
MYLIPLTSVVAQTLPSKWADSKVQFVLNEFIVKQETGNMVGTYNTADPKEPLTKRQIKNMYTGSIYLEKSVYTKAQRLKTISGIDVPKSWWDKVGDKDKDVMKANKVEDDVKSVDKDENNNKDKGKRIEIKHKEESNESRDHQGQNQAERTLDSSSQNDKESDQKILIIKDSEKTSACPVKPRILANANAEASKDSVEKAKEALKPIKISNLESSSHFPILKDCYIAINVIKEETEAAVLKEEDLAKKKKDSLDV